MAVYVDELVFESRGRMWCHLLADSDQELHRFAGRLGLPSSAFHRRRARPWRDHYDLTEDARVRAIGLGALEISFHDAGLHLARRRRELRLAGRGG